MTIKPQCSLEEWTHAKNWNRDHPKSEGRMRAVIHSSGQNIAFYLDQYGTWPAPGWKDCPFPRENSRAVEWVR